MPFGSLAPDVTDPTDIGGQPVEGTALGPGLSWLARKYVPHVIAGILNLPQQAAQASEDLRTTGEYDPAAPVNAALMTMGGTGFGAPRGAIGAGPTLQRSVLPMDEASRMARAADQGYTIPAYHATKEEFDTFDPRKTGDIGIHFGTAEQANQVIKPYLSAASGKPTGYEEGANILPVQLKMDNPLRVKDQFSTLGTRFINRAKQWTLETPNFLANAAERGEIYEAAKRADLARRRGGGDWSIQLDPSKDNARQAYEGASRDFWQAIQKSAQRQGYDGLVYSNRVEGKGDSYVVFDPSQVRSRFAAFDPANQGSGYLLGAGPTDRRAASALIAGASDQPTGIRAYHGSPYDFDRFDLSKIGTGEGSQAYGHGLYFSELPEVAAGYRKQLAHSPNVYLDNKNVGPVSELVAPPMKVGSLSSTVTTPGVRAGLSNPNLSALPERAQEALAGSGSVGSLDEAIATMREQAGQSWRGKAAQKIWNERADALEALRGRLEIRPGGRMYEVNINARPEQFLDWDRPLSEQHPEVQQALTSLGVSIPKPPQMATIADPVIRGIVRRALGQNEGKAENLGLIIDNDAGLYHSAIQHAKNRGRDLEGEDIRASDYVEQQARPFLDALHHAQNSTAAQVMQRAYGNPMHGGDLIGKNTATPEELTAGLRESGIPGIRYLDQGSRGSGQGTSNYVVFDDKLIDIIRKYGLAGLAAGPAAAGGASAFGSLSPRLPDQSQ